MDDITKALVDHQNVRLITLLTALLGVRATLKSITRDLTLPEGDMVMIAKSLKDADEALYAMVKSIPENET